MVAPIRFLSGRQQQQKIGVEGNTQDQKVLEVVGRAGIGTTIFDVNVELEVRGDASISGILTVGNFNVTGVSTFASDLDINASIDVDGHTELDDLNVSGVSTFASDLDINASIDIDGHTELDDLNVSGVSTFADVVSIGATVGIGTIIDIVPYDTLYNGTLSFQASEGQLFSISNNLTSGSIFSVNDVSGIPSIDVDADGTIQLAPFGANEYVGVGTTNPSAKLDVNGTLNVSGFSTFASDLDINASVDIQNDVIVGGALTVSGISTFASDLDINASVDISNNLYISGITTSLGGIQAIGIQSNRSNITSGVITTFNFVGTAVSTITNTNGFVEFNFKAGTFVKNVTSFTATQGQTVFSVNYVPGYIDVYLNGVRLTASEYTATNGTSIVLPSGAIAGDIIDVNVFENSGLFNSSKWVALDPYNEIGGDIYKLDGNVGIGTSNPTAKLDVNGGIRLRGALYDSNNVIGNPGELLTITGAGVSWTTSSTTPSGRSVKSISASTSYYITAAEITSGVSTAAYIDSNIVIRDGNVGIGTTNPTAKLDVSGKTELDDLNVSGVSTFNDSLNIADILQIGGSAISISTTTAVTIDTLSTSSYRSAKFQVQITQSSNYQSSDLMVIHNGTTSSLIEYGSIATNDYLGEFSSTISGSNLLLQLTMNTDTSATVKVVRYGVTI